MTTPAPSSGEPVLLGTVALEPNRWGTIRADRSPSTVLADHLDAIAAAGFDGIELWENHLSDDVVAHPLPIPVFNTYVGFDDPDPAARDRVASAVARCGSRGVKFNVGNDPAAEADYTSRLADWVDRLPAGTAAICECHDGISIAEDPRVAARILEGVGPASAVQALVHTHDADHVLRAKFEALGPRITHVHVNFLDQQALTHPTLAEVEDLLGARVALLRQLGFTGSWTLEFVAGLLTPDDEPHILLDRAIADLAVLRRTITTETS